MLTEWARRWGISPQAIAELRGSICRTYNSPPPVKLGASEASVQQRIRLEAPKHGVILWRNNNGATSDDKGNFIRYGLANDSKQMSENIKSSDLIGITPQVITNADIGRTLGVFTAIEVKRPDWHWLGTARELAQRRFIEIVISQGGRALFATDPTDIWRP